MAAADQVASPRVHPGRRIGTILPTQDVGIEPTEPLGVGLGRAPHDETIAEIAKHDLGSVGPRPGVVNRVRVTVTA